MEKIFRIICSTLILILCIGAECLALIDKSVFWLIISLIFAFLFTYNIVLLSKQTSCKNENCVTKQGDNVLTLNGGFFNNINQSQ